MPKIALLAALVSLPMAAVAATSPSFSPPGIFNLQAIVTPSLRATGGSISGVDTTGATVVYKGTSVSIGSIAALAETAIAQSLMGVANGVATLDSTGAVPVAQIPASIFSATQSAANMANAALAKANTAVPVSTGNLANGYAQLGSSALLSSSVFPAFTGDVTSTAGTTALTLATTGINPGACTKPTFDAKGRATTCGVIAPTDLPIASTSAIGGVRPDGTSITESANGTLTANVTNASATDTIARNAAAAAQSTASAAVPQNTANQANGYLKLNGSALAPLTSLPIGGAGNLVVTQSSGLLLDSIMPLDVTAGVAQAGTALQPANNLSDLKSISSARMNLGLGTASLLAVGGNSGVAQLDTSGALSANVVKATWANAAARTLAAHFSDSINVKDFGAVGDAEDNPSEDDTAAIQGAINIAETIDLGATVVIPQGHYRVTATLLAIIRGDGGIHIVGAGPSETMIESDIPSGASNYDGLDIVGTPPTCLASGCFDYSSPWRGSGLNGGVQGQSSTVENLTFKVTGGPGYPAGSMISASTGYAYESETQFPWLTIQNVNGTTLGPNSPPDWVNGVNLINPYNVTVRHLYFDNHASKAAGSGVDAGGYAAGAGVMIVAGGSYSSQSQGVILDDIQTGGFEAGVAVGGTAQGLKFSNLNNTSVNGGNEYAVALGGGMVFAQGNAAPFALSGYNNSGDYQLFVSSSAGLSSGMKIIPSTGDLALGVVPTGAIIDQVGTTANSSGFYPVSWTTPADYATTAITSDSFTFKPSSGTTVTGTCSVALNSSTLSCSSLSGALAANMAITDTTPGHGSYIPSTSFVFALPSTTTAIMRPSSQPAFINGSPNSAGSPTATVSYLFAQPLSVVLDDPYGTGGTEVNDISIGHYGIWAPSSPFDYQGGWGNIYATGGSVQSDKSLINNIGGTGGSWFRDFDWNNGTGTFINLSNSGQVDISRNMLNGSGATTPALIIVSGSSAVTVDGNIATGATLLGTDTNANDGWGKNYYGGAWHDGLAGETESFDSSFAGGIATGSGSYVKRSSAFGAYTGSENATLTLGPLPIVANGFYTLEGELTCGSAPYNNAAASWRVIAHYMGGSTMTAGDLNLQLEGTSASSFITGNTTIALLAGAPGLTVTETGTLYGLDCSFDASGLSDQ